MPIQNTSLEAGNRTKIELYVVDVEAVLVSNDTADVKIPSENLKIVKNFEIKTNETTRFVFDINVVRTGHKKNEYNLLLVIANSSVVGKDLKEDEVVEV